MSKDKEIERHNRGEMAEADPRVYVIEIPKHIRDSEIDLIQTYKDEIERLTEKLKTAEANLASLRGLIEFKEALSLRCSQHGRITILQCATRIKIGKCLRPCVERLRILEKLAVGT